jgi:FtsP/CotA-like multicopper oxidase with cupredoxin domain
MDRRRFVAQCAATAWAATHRPGPGDRRGHVEAPDYTLRIAPATLELAPGKTTRTVLYNGTAPGPLLRVREGATVTIDVVNQNSELDFVHWHGLAIPAEVDGAADEGTPPVPPGEQRRYTFTAKPAGTRWYHSHNFAGTNLRRSTYTGQFGFILVDPSTDPGRYDQEILLALRDWEPYLTGGDDGFRAVAYQHSSINDRLLGAGPPIRVRQGQRVLFRLLNASATDAHWLSLPHHEFLVVALDGNPVPTPTEVTQLRLDPGERIDAIVTMDAPGVWVLGEPRASVRKMGMGIVVEYADQRGEPVADDPGSLHWSYLPFGSRPDATPRGVDVENIPLVFRSAFHGHGDLEHWTINGRSYPDTPVPRLTPGRRYRFQFDNQSVEDHPLHLHRHTMELTRMAGTATAGIRKDVITVPAQTRVDAEFVADNPGKSLLHCHLQDHMDAGFMMLFDYA